MFTPESMEQIHVVFSDRDLDAVSTALVRDGSMQLIDAADMEKWAGHLAVAGSGEMSETMRQRKELLESIFLNLHVSPNLKEFKEQDISWTEQDEKILKLRKELDQLFNSQEKSGRELNRLRELIKHVREMPNLDIGINHQSSHSYLAVQTGRIAVENLPILEKQLAATLHVLAPLAEFNGLTTVVVVAMRRDREQIERAMREAGAQPIEKTTESETLTPDVIKSLDDKLTEAQTEFNRINAKIKVFSDREFGFFNTALLKVKKEVLKQQILKYFRKTERTYLVSGWLPTDDAASLIAEIKRVTQNRCVIERLPAGQVDAVREGKVEVPVKMKNPKVFRPFELITGAYGLPAYGTLDPTPVLGISFLLMFGMMFGDVGHGLVLLLLGLYLVTKGKAEFQKHAGLLLCYVGTSSMIFGFLFGSLFGFEQLSWLPPLWLRPMESIETLFKVCIYFGIGMIFTSIAINMINAFRLRKFWHIIFDKAGLLAAVLYWSGIVLASRVVTSSTATPGFWEALAPILMVIALVLLFVREPILHLLEGKKKMFPEGAFSGVINGLIELMEIALGFLANTVSFIRVAAFGLVHAGLAMAIFSLADSMSNFGSVVMIIFGNIFIICLEGLVVSIQSVRLEFYEFFSRFFREGKLGYKPMRSELQ